MTLVQIALIIGLASFLAGTIMVTTGGMRGIAAGACLLVVGILTVSVAAKIGSDKAERRFLAEEISDQDYRNLAIWKRSDCALDRMMAKAMADGRVTQGEAKPMWARTGEITRGRSRALLGGIDPSATCRTGMVKA